MKKALLGITAAAVALTAQVRPVIEEYTYAVVLSNSTYNDSEWREVADELKEKHGAIDSRILTYTNSIEELRDTLSAFMPTYVGIVAKPVSECNSNNYSIFSRFMRTLDSDPYPDAIWSVITGYEAGDALRAVKDSLKIKTMLWGSGGSNETSGPLRRVEQGVGIECDSYTRTKYSFPDGQVLDIEQRPDGNRDRIPLLVDWLNSEDINVTVDGYPTINGPLDLIQTGGHGNTDIWQAHYNDAGMEGYLRSYNGQLYGHAYDGTKTDINVPTPKVYMATVNCQVGSPDNINNMVYAWFHTGRAINMHGFMPDSEYGNDFMGNGVYDRFTKFSGKFNLPESYYYGQVNSVFELEKPTGFYYSDRINYFLDTVAIYGDPKANAYIACESNEDHIYKEDLTMDMNDAGDSATFTFRITLNSEKLTMGKGFSYQMRPIAFLPRRIDANSVEILSNTGSNVEIVDNLIIWDMMSPNSSVSQGDNIAISWKAKLLPPLFDNQSVSASAIGSAKKQTGTLIWQNNSLALSGNFNSKSQVTIMSLRGQKLYDGTASAKSLAEISLSSGLYLWQIKDGFNTSAGKMMIK